LIVTLTLFWNQFPDPWRRSKHQKRLIVQPGLVALLQKHMSAGAAVYLSSDCKLIAEAMRSQLLHPVQDGENGDEEEDAREGGMDGPDGGGKRAGCSGPADGSPCSAMGRFRLVQEFEMAQASHAEGGEGEEEGDTSGESSRPAMEDNAFIGVSTRLQTAPVGSDGWIAFNPLVG
jgi:hypothetical protein